MSQSVAQADPELTLYLRQAVNVDPPASASQVAEIPGLCIRP